MPYVRRHYRRPPGTGRRPKSIEARLRRLEEIAERQRAEVEQRQQAEPQALMMPGKGD